MTIHPAAEPVRPQPARQAANEQLVGFRLGEEEYAVEISNVREIILPDRVTRIPHAPDYVKGLINLRNSVVPVISLRRRMGLDEEEVTGDTRIVIAFISGKTVGLIVDSVSEVFRISRDQVSPLPPAADGGRFLRGFLNLGERLVILINIDGILDEGT